MNIYAELIDMADKKYDFTNCISFYFVKEVYTPYTLFEGTFVMPSTIPHDINRVAFYIDNKNIHFGIVDSIDFFSFVPEPACSGNESERHSLRCHVGIQHTVCHI